MKAFSDGVLVGPEAIGKVLIDDSDARRIRLVGFQKAPSVEDGNMCGFEVTVADDGIESRRRLFAAPQSVSFENHGSGVEPETERDDLGQSGRANAGSRTLLIEKLFIKFFILRLVVVDHR